jgi:hypothetical protein
VIDTIPAIVLTVERAIAVVPNVNNVPECTSRNLPAVVICKFRICNRASKHWFVTVPVSPEVINIPVAGIKCSHPATADGTNVTVPEVDPKQSIKFQLKLS